MMRRISLGRIDPDRVVGGRIDQNVAVGVREQNHQPQAIHDVRVFRVIRVRGPERPRVFDAQIALGFAPDLFQNGAHVAFRLNLQAVAEIQADHHQQRGKQQQVADGQPEPQPAHEIHMERRTSIRSTIFSAARSGVSSMYPMPRTVWIIFCGHLSSILLRRWRMYTSTILVSPS